MSRRWVRGLLGRTGGDRHLVYSYLYPPAAETSGIVVAKRIREWGVDTDVIAHVPPGGREPDSGTLRVAGPHEKRVLRLRTGENALKDWSVAEDFARAAVREALRLERRGGRYRSIYSRSMMPASHLAAAIHKLERPSARWVAEFSDPLLLDTRGDRRTAPVPDTSVVRKVRRALDVRGVPQPGADEMFELIESLVYALADEIVFTNANQRELMLGAVADPALRERASEVSRVVPHPSPAPELYTTVVPRIDLSPEVLHVGYFGIFFGTRSVDDLLEAFARLDAQESRLVQLHVFTDRPRRAAKRVRAAGLADRVNVQGFVPYLDFLALARELDLLVVTDARAVKAHGINPYLPSKLSDYRGAGTRIWAMVEDGSPMAQDGSLETTPLGDPGAGVALLRRVLAERAVG